MTVFQNGVKIHDNVEVTSRTTPPPASAATRASPARSCSRTTAIRCSSATSGCYRRKGRYGRSETTSCSALPQGDFDLSFRAPVEASIRGDPGERETINRNPPKGKCQPTL